VPARQGFGNRKIAAVGAVFGLTAQSPAARLLRSRHGKCAASSQQSSRESAAKERFGTRQVIGANAAIFLFINPREGRVVPARRGFGNRKIAAVGAVFGLTAQSPAARLLRNDHLFVAAAWLFAPSMISTEQVGIQQSVLSIR